MSFNNNNPRHSSSSSSTSPYSSPLPSPIPSSSLFSSLNSSIPIHPDAVLEKNRLSTSRFPRRNTTSFKLFPSLSNYFVPYPLHLPFFRRRFIVPIPHFFLSNFAQSNSQNYLSTLPRHSRKNPHRRSYPISLFYILLILSFILLTFGIIRSAFKNSSHRIPLPFQDPSTLVLNEEDIRRIWEWEISNGHYPSSRRTPTVVGLDRVPNPSLPRSSSSIDPTSSHAFSNSHFDDHVAIPPIRSLQQNQLRAPPSFLDDIIPVGPSRSYLNITSPSVYRLNHSSYLNSPSQYPPRPISNAILDLDVIMDYCDFSTNQYVRDCLEILRMGASLDIGKRVRRGETARWRHIYHERNDDGSVRSKSTLPPPAYDPILHSPVDEERGEQLIKDPSYQPIDVLDLIKSDSYQQKVRQIQRQIHNTADSRRKSSTKYPTHPTADPTCDHDYPKIFHIFWAGPFTDKPYLALSSFLFTQNLGLHLPLASRFKGATMNQQEKIEFARRSEFLSQVCRPQLWVWINPGPAAAIPNPNARRQMFNDLRNNPWSAPFLHPRFSEVIKFKMWNTTEQLDGVPELRDHWRELPLFNSGGVKYGSAPTAPVKSHQHDPSFSDGAQSTKSLKIGIVVPEDQAKLADKDGDGQAEVPDVVEEELGRFGNHTRGEAAVAEDLSATQAQESSPAASPIASATATTTPKKKPEEELFQRVGSTSSKGYDRLSVVLSDMARFVLCHRFGGIYLDADTILLRDWEELWGWRGQFAYRWSRLEKYNTAVLRLHRHSAVGSFLFKTALANGLDFHPMTISRYTKDAYLDGLLLRLPDALFDSAWLNTEYYQRDRPAFPYFKRFEDFFDPPSETNAGPAAIGFDGFFRGAFSYHFHNFWWIPFDPSRNFPDLGKRFQEGEKVIRVKALVEKMSGQRKDHSGAAQAREKLEERLMKTIRLDEDDVADDERDLGWATVLKRTFEAFLRCERPNMYGEWLDWTDEH